VAIAEALLPTRSGVKVICSPVQYAKQFLVDELTALVRIDPEDREWEQSPRLLEPVLDDQVLVFLDVDVGGGIT
jgi:hypothetical protein